MSLPSQNNSICSDTEFSGSISKPVVEVVNWQLLNEFNHKICFVGLVKYWSNNKIWTSISFSAKTGWDRVEFHLMDKEGGLQFSSSLTTPYCLPNNKAKCGLSYH